MGFKGAVKYKSDFPALTPLIVKGIAVMQKLLMVLAIVISFCLTIAVLLGSVGTAQAKGFGIALLLGSMGTVQSKGFGEFNCQNIQNLNIDDAGEVIDRDLAKDSFTTKIVINKRRVGMIYPSGDGSFPIETVHIGKWMIDKNGMYNFLVDESKDGFALSRIAWTEYGLGTFRKYEANRTRLSLYNCKKSK